MSAFIGVIKAPRNGKRQRSIVGFRPKADKAKYDTQVQTAPIRFERARNRLYTRNWHELRAIGQQQGLAKCKNCS
jgi:hypothetical protein